MLAVVALDLDAVRVHHLAEAGEQRLVAAGAMQAIAGIGGADRFQVEPALGAQATLVLAVDAELQLKGQLHGIAEGGCAVEDAAEHLARGDRGGLPVCIGVVADHGGHARLPGGDAEGIEVGVGDDIRVAGVPAGELQVGHELLGDIPAEDHVALGEAVGEAFEEGVRGEAFTAIDAIEVGRAEHDRLHALCGDQVAYLLFGHAVVLSVGGRVPGGQRVRTSGPTTAVEW